MVAWPNLSASNQGTREIWPRVGQDAGHQAWSASWAATVRQESKKRPSDKKARRVLGLYKGGLSYRRIGRHVGLDKYGHADRQARNSAIVACKLFCCAKAASAGLSAD